MNKIKVRITFVEPVLGSSSNNPNIFGDFTAAKAATAAARAEEEACVIGVMTEAEREAAVEKSTTVFPRNANRELFSWDYQWRGFFKEALAVATDIGEEEVSELSHYSVKKSVDSLLFVAPRKIPFLNSEGKPITTVDILERPLRGNTPQGERICLARSESLPAGTQLELAITWMDSANPKTTILHSSLIWCLDYGILKGFGQWRGGGFGRFEYVVLETNIDPKRAAGIKVAKGAKPAKAAPVAQPDNE